MMSEYIEFVDEEPSPSGKTRRIVVRSINHGDELGTIRWYSPWRQYTFLPNELTIWNSKCLDEIKGFLVTINVYHKQLLSQRRLMKEVLES